MMINLRNILLQFFNINKVGYLLKMCEQFCYLSRISGEKLAKSELSKDITTSKKASTYFKKANKFILFVTRI